MTTLTPATSFADPAPAQHLEQAATALRAQGFTIEILDDAAATALGGRFSAHGAPSGGFAQIDRQEAERRDITVRGIEHVQFAPLDAKALTERAMSKAVAKQIRPIIGQTFPLKRAADAHRAIEARDVIGKTLLVI